MFQRKPEIVRKPEKTYEKNIQEESANKKSAKSI